MSLKVHLPIEPKIYATAKNSCELLGDSYGYGDLSMNKLMNVSITALHLASKFCFCPTMISVQLKN